MFCLLFQAEMTAVFLQLGDESLPDKLPDLGSDEEEPTEEQQAALQTLHHVLLEVSIRKEYQSCTDNFVG